MDKLDEIQKKFSGFKSQYPGVLGVVRTTESLAVKLREKEKMPGLHERQDAAIAADMAEILKDYPEVWESMEYERFTEYDAIKVYSDYERSKTLPFTAGDTDR